MPQKIVIKMDMTSDRCRSKAMALVAATIGVDSVALAGDGRDQVVVVGNGIDYVRLTTALRKKVGKAKEEKKPAEAATAAVVEYTYQPWNYYRYPSHAVSVYEHPAGAYGYKQCHSRPGTCSIT